MRLISNDPWTRSQITEPWVYWDDAFSHDELIQLVDYCSNLPLSPGLTFEGGNAQEGEANLARRRSKVGFSVKDHENAWIFDRLNGIITCANDQFYEFDLNGYREFQYTEYHADEEGFYDWHMDMCLGNDRGSLIETRKLSMTFCLNDDYEGGEFLINTGTQESPMFVPTRAGRAILFPSWMLHTVRPITRGVRKSLVVWCTGPKFR